MFIVMNSKGKREYYGVFDSLEHALIIRDTLNQQRKSVYQTIYVYELSQPELES